MVNIRRYVGGEYLQAADFDRPRPLTICGGEEKVMKDGRVKAVVYFEEESKGLVLNATNSAVLEQLCNSSETDHMIGFVVIGYRTSVAFQGEDTPCVRLREPKAESEFGRANTARIANMPEDWTRTDEENQDDIPF